MMKEDEEFTVRLRELDNDSLIQTEAAVNDCLSALYNGTEFGSAIVRLEASQAAEDIQREILRRAKLGTHVKRKRTTTT